LDEKRLLAGLSLTLASQNDRLLPSFAADRGALGEHHHPRLLRTDGDCVVILLLIGSAMRHWRPAARGFFRNPKAIRRLNRVTGGILAVAAGAVIVR